MKIIRQILIIFIILLSTQSLYANASIFISKASIFIDKENLNIKQIKKKEFKEFFNKHQNFGFNNKINIWLKLQINNNSNIKSNKILDFNNPLLEEVILYDNLTLSKSGILNIDNNRTTINPIFDIKIAANTSEVYYVKIKNTTTALQFSINLIDNRTFFNDDLKKQFTIILFIGIILAFLIYAMVLYFYANDISYLFYSLYIIILLFQQLTYVGFLPLYMPEWFTYVDNLIVVPKVGMVIITGILFARSFLKTKNYPHLDNIYKLIIYFVVLQMIFISSPNFYYPELTVLTGLFFICFNLYTAIYVYKKGNKQARFFIVGWCFLIIGFFLSIIDALGIYSVMYNFPSLVLILTAIEALFLLLAFVDKLNILQQEKDIADNKYVNELHQRNMIIAKEVESRTLMLKNLYKELHHRVKNNLQIMLSIIRLQSDKITDEDTKEQFLKLENRIKSISKTHEILYLNDDLEQVDMYEYIYSLSEDIEMSYSKDIEFNIDTKVSIPLKDAVYVGIIINELITNSMKYSNCTKVCISLTKDENNLHLYIDDNGIGYEQSEVSDSSLGLTLVEKLVVSQLKGEIIKNTKNRCEYNIRLKI
jgi:two-component sensor histidine kinase